MDNILEDLKKYFRETPRDQVLKDWAEAKKNSPKGGPKLKEFLDMTRVMYRPTEEFFTLTGKNIDEINPEYIPGCFF